MSSSGTPVCGYYFVKQGEANDFLDYDGSSLKQCTRCKGSYYVDQDAQKQNWKRHKKCCKMLESKTISRMPLGECTAYLKRTLRGGNGGPELYHVIKRLRVLFDDDDDGTSDAAYELHTLGRGLIFTPGDHMMTIASCPYMARLLISDEEDLLSKKLRFHKFSLDKYSGRPTDEFIEDIEDEEERKEARKMSDQYDALDSAWGQPSSMSFCYLYFNLIVACAIHGSVSHISIHDGKGLLRGGDPREKSAASLLSTAALRRAMELWTNPLVLASCGDAMAPAASLAVGSVNYYIRLDMLGEQPLCRKHELVPGLSIDRAAMTCFSELSEGAGSAQYSADLLAVLARVCGAEEMYQDLPVERRVSFVLAAVRFITDKEDGPSSSSFGRDLDIPWAYINVIFKALCAMNPVNNVLAKSVLQKAADEGEKLGPLASGQNVDTRSFFYYLLRGNSPSEGWEHLDVVKLVKDFDKIPRIHRAPDDAKAKEKDECLRLAYGNKRHEELNAIFRS